MQRLQQQYCFARQNSYPSVYLPDADFAGREATGEAAAPALGKWVGHDGVKGVRGCEVVLFVVEIAGQAGDD